MSVCVMAPVVPGSGVKRRPAGQGKRRAIRPRSYRVLPCLRDALCRLIFEADGSLPRGHFSIRSLEIRDNQVYLKYVNEAVGSMESEASGVGRSVVQSSLQVWSLNDDRVREQLDTVYQVR